MAIKKCYRLWAIKGDDLTQEQLEFVYDIDEDYYTKSSWLSSAKHYTNLFNLKFGTNHRYQDLFGEPNDTKGWCYCTECGESFWESTEHEC